MKTLKTLFAASLLLFGIGFASCSKDEAVKPDGPVNLPTDGVIENPIERPDTEHPIEEEIPTNPIEGEPENPVYETNPSNPIEVDLEHLPTDGAEKPISYENSHTTYNKEVVIFYQ